MSDLGERLERMPSDQKRATLASLPSHLAKAAQPERFQSLLTNFGFLDAKVFEANLGVQPLIEDYDLALDPRISIPEENKYNLTLIQDAIRLSASILDQDKTQLAGQLLGRLLSYKVPAIEKLLKQAKQRKHPWLQPLTSSLTPPGGPLLRTLTGHTEWINAVAITPDGKHVISGADDKTIKVWRWETGAELFTLSGHTDSVYAVAVTPDGKKLISASKDKTIKVWDWETQKDIFTFSGHTDTVNTVVLTPNGKQVISGSDDKTIKVFNLDTGEEIFTLKGHTVRVNAVAVNPKGNQIISGSDDKTIKVFNLDTGEEIFTLKGHTDTVKV
ncbi:MAG: WD40 repeat domain-containing protein, partial [Moorea sp. SIO3C2]|nr:WD40 repeat domain-containing protein [Moorena sp. SIO3C2]